MATTKNRKTSSPAGVRTSSQKKAAGRRQTAGSRGTKGKKAAAAHSSLVRDIVLLFLIALAILLFLSLFGIVGAIGRALASLQFGLFGSLAYAFPFLFLLLVAFGISNMKEYPVNTLLRILAALFTFSVLCGILELIGSGGEILPKLETYYRMGRGNRMHGGFFGGLWCRLCLGALGRVGSYVILLVLFLAGLVLTFGKALLTAVGITGGKVAHAIKNENVRRRELNAQRRQLAAKRAEERMLRRENEREERARREQESRQALMDKLDEKLARERAGARNTGLSRGADQGAFRTKESSSGGWLFRKKPQTLGLTRGSEIDFRETDLKTPKLPEQSSLEELFREMESHKAGEEGTSKGRNSVRREERTLDELLQLENASSHIKTGTRGDTQSSKKPLEKTERGEALSQVFDEYDQSRRKEEKPALRIRMAQGEEEETLPETLPDIFPESLPDNLPESLPDPSGAPREEAQTWMDPRTRLNKTADEDGFRTDKKESSRAGEGEESLSYLEPAKKEYKLPPIHLLKKAPRSAAARESDLKRTAGLLEETLRNFGVEVTVTDISCGPSVTRYELKPEQGVKVSRISALADDIKLALAATEIRIEAPIPGKSAVGIEVPNTEKQTVSLRSIVESEEFKRTPSKIAFAVGQDISGRVIVADLAKMPHLLIAGATGSGKSVCINSLITSILYRAKPDEVQFIMIDPKVVELGDYNGIPHLRIPVVTDAKLAAEALNGAVKEMTGRYKKFADLNVRDIKSYNAKLRENPEEYADREILPQIVVIVDEFADLMMVASGDVEQSVCRLAQLARAAGIHLVLATQRPSVNVITGLIKANIQSRIALTVSSGVDSRTIIDMNGAEKLLGKGDMLFYPTGYPKPVRVQGCWVDDSEIEEVTNFWKKQNVVSQEELAQQNKEWMAEPADKDRGSREERDELFLDAAEYIIDNEKASIGNLQRVFRIGFNRAARLMDQLADAGIVGKDDGTKARQIQMDRGAFENWKRENGL